MISKHKPKKMYGFTLQSSNNIVYHQCTVAVAVPGAPDGIWDWYGRAQRDVTRARSARAPKGLLKIAGKWCKSRAP